MPEYKLFAQRVGLVGITTLIVNLRGLILIPILTKTLGTDAYGIWSIIMVTLSLLSPLALLGLTTAMIRFLAVEKEEIFGIGAITNFCRDRVCCIFRSERVWLVRRCCFALNFKRDCSAHRCLFYIQRDWV
uniref:Polysaccharide biosynthesis protein C-terminal domain-containing protein n=1 Tax=Candidatus Methanophaga sp. ANME-1 ERB7 TaxID=2759913 RepID=A0A7G9Z257_9EURY|nr:hypothetical protein DIMBOPOO_00013 [Methanosarcinales archaeon ANME-1 ERB7]